MCKHICVFLWLVIISNVGNAVDNGGVFNFLGFKFSAPTEHEKFFRPALQLLSINLNIDGEIKNFLSEDPRKYFEVALKIYQRCPQTLETENKNADDNALTAYDQKEQSIIDQQKDATPINSQSIHDIKSISELENALINNQWMAIKNCLITIASSAMRILIDSDNAENLSYVKEHFNSQIPPEIRNKIGDFFWRRPDSKAVTSWLLEQNIFLHDGKDKLIRQLMNDCLSKNNLTEANKIINHLRGDSENHAMAVRIFFHFFVNRNQIDEAALVMKKFLQKGDKNYEVLAEIIFKYHLDRGDAKSAEASLSQNYQKGFPSRNYLVKILTDHLCGKNGFDQALKIAEHHMCVETHEFKNLKLEILAQQVKFLKNKENFASF